MSKYFLYIPWLLCMAFIFTLSHIPSTGGPPPAWLPDWAIYLLGLPHFDKIIHFSEYCTLTCCAILSKSKPVTIFIINCIFALSDEWHQSFIPGRHADVYDFLADCLGVIVTLMLLNFIKNKSKTQI